MCINNSDAPATIRRVRKAEKQDTGICEIKHIDDHTLYPHPSMISIVKDGDEMLPPGLAHATGSDKPVAPGLDTSDETACGDGPCGGAPGGFTAKTWPG